MFEYAEAAVEGALAAGAATPMRASWIGPQAMGVRDGEVEGSARRHGGDRRAGPDRLSWGFFATRSDAAARRAGERAAAIARASASSPAHLELADVPVSQRTGRTRTPRTRSPSR